jgi:hypothetical protein
MPVTTEWFILAVVKLVVLVWQLLHAIVVVGMCGGVVMPCAPAVPWLVKEPLWQELQEIPVTAEWFIV